MIIAINAKIGCGKDTVGSIIQKLHPEGNWKIKKWAGKLKQTATLLTGVPMEMWEDQDFKRLSMGEKWGNMTYREFLQKLGTDAIRDGLYVNSWINALMADYTQPVPEKLALFNDLYKPKTPNWIITDTRFPNEADAARSAGGIVIRINRKCQACGGDNTDRYSHKMGCSALSAGGHPSETSLDDYTFDYVIDNNGTIVDLEQEVSKFINQFNLWQK